MTGDERSGAPTLLVGPLLRYAGTENATIWVETSRACEVEVIGCRARTFQLDGHHYALVLVEGLQPDSVTPYDVRLDGIVVWPPDDGRPHCAIRTRNGERRLRLMFGSCRVGAPQPQETGTPWVEEVRRTGIDALWAYARQLQDGARPWPDALMLLGDQVYADEVSPVTAEFIRSRRSIDEPPGEQVADFEEYTRLYREAWSDPDLRWLLSTVPSMMVFDDHDVIDDWNISASWVEEIRREPWWDARITGAFMAYWVYQHIGNLSPPELAEEEMLARVSEDMGDAGDQLRAFARMCDRETAACRWAYYRDFGDSRVLVLDSRAARVLTAGRREMIDDDEWAWVVDRTHGDFDHLVLCSTLPVFMSHGVHHLEAWNEAICAGAWGKWWERVGERLRRGVDLEHWPAFQSSLARLVDLVRDTADGERPHRPPASIVFLGGDIHSAYVAEVDLGLGDHASRVHQVVCSPFRNPLSRSERRIVRITGSRITAVVFSALARLAGVRRIAASWRYLQSPSFDNAIGELVLNDDEAEVTIRRAAREGEDAATLIDLHTTRLADRAELST